MRAAAVLLALARAAHAAAPVSPATPCETVLPAQLEVSLEAEPLDPAVGDVVDLDARITNTTGGLAGIPLFRLAGAEPQFAIEAQENSYPYVEGARYRLRAVRPGLATLRLSVNFETSSGCVDVPLFVFHSTSSPLYSITVRGELPTIAGSPTPTATPTPALRRGSETPRRRRPSMASGTDDSGRCGRALRSVTAATEVALAGLRPRVAISALVAAVNGARVSCATPKRSRSLSSPP
jgi:hypothetical protein